MRTLVLLLESLTETFGLAYGNLYIHMNQLCLLTDDRLIGSESEENSGGMPKGWRCDPVYIYGSLLLLLPRLMPEYWIM